MFVEVPKRRRPVLTAVPAVAATPDAKASAAAAHEPVPSAPLSDQSARAVSHPDLQTWSLAMTGTPEHASLSPEAARILEESITSVREALSGLKYGNVSLTVHEGRVVQIDVTEKKRLKPN